MVICWGERQISDKSPLLLVMTWGFRMSSYDRIWDELAAAAFEAIRVDRLSPTQVNKLLEVYESTGRDLNTLLAFVARQVGRGQWGRGTSARRLYEILRSVKADDIRKVLGVFKWLFEACHRKRFPPNMRPGRPAEKGFFLKYLEACMR